MSFPAPEPASAHPDNGAGTGGDQAVAFLNALLPPSPAERSRAFAALLRAMTSRTVR